MAAVCSGLCALSTGVVSEQPSYHCDWFQVNLICLTTKTVDDLLHLKANQNMHIQWKRSSNLYLLYYWSLPQRPEIRRCFITFQLLKPLCVAKDHLCGFITRNAHMVHIVNFHNFNCDTSYIVSVHIQCQTSIYIHFRCFAVIHGGCS